MSSNMVKTLREIADKIESGQYAYSVRLYTALVDIKHVNALTGRLSDDDLFKQLLLLESETKGFYAIETEGPVRLEHIAEAQVLQSIIGKDEETHIADGMKYD